MTRGSMHSVHASALFLWRCGAGLLGLWSAVQAQELAVGPEVTLAAVGPLREAGPLLEAGSRGRLTWHAPGRVEIRLQRYERAWDGPVQAGSAPGRLALGVYVGTGGATQVGWQSRPYGTEHLPPWLQDVQQRPPEGAALRAADPLADLRLGALARFSFGGQTSLSLRPRKGGVRLMLQSQW
jgi:hypothetical protein